ncbi:hypothetical protein C0585_04215 [Candidatus Woesearchaeota archaeon]|nr:MAG: hypothetical protein C0585_04215 [Candidatus Woesearchaeota archaeon]
MVNLDALIYFLRKYGNLDNDNLPIYRANDIPEQIHHPLALTQSFRRSDPLFYTPPKSGDDIYEKDFEKIGIDSQNIDDFESRLTNIIPNSINYALIDIGSLLGGRLTRPFARTNPLVSIVMVDNMNIETIENEIMNSQKFDKYPNRLENVVKIDEKDISNSIIEIMIANNYKNIHFVNKFVTPVNYLLGINNLINGKEKVISSFKTPIIVGETMHYLAEEYKPKSIIFHNKVISDLGDKDKTPRFFDDFLGKHFELNEIAKLKKIYLDYKTSKDLDSKGNMFFAYSLHSLYGLAHKEKFNELGYDVELKQLEYTQKINYFNNPLVGIITNRK